MQQLDLKLDFVLIMTEIKEIKENAATEG